MRVVAKIISSSFLISKISRTFQPSPKAENVLAPVKNVSKCCAFQLYRNYLTIFRRENLIKGLINSHLYGCAQCGTFEIIFIAGYHCKYCTGALLSTFAAKLLRKTNIIPNLSEMWPLLFQFKVWMLFASKLF